MTREEAIEFGNMWLQINEDSKNSHTYKFFQMAIKAIEQDTFINKPCVSEKSCEHDKNVVIDKIRAKIVELDNKVCQQFLIEDVDKEVHHAYQDCLEIIDTEQKVRNRMKKTNTHIVIKREDIFKYLTDNQIKYLDDILNTIADGRKKDGKKPDNSYYICNTDEPYANEVLDVILKAESEDKELESMI